MAAGAPAKRRSVQWRGWSPRDKLKGSTAATNFTAVSAPSEDDGERQPKNGGSSRHRRHTLEISFEMLGRAIAIGRQKTSRSYGDVGVVIDEVEEEKEEKEEVGDPTSAAPKDKAATLPAATVSHASAADVTSSETADGRGGGKSGKSRRRPRRHTLGFGLLGRAVAKGRRWRASHFDNDDRDDISDELDGEEVSGATPARERETDKKETAAESAASGAFANVAVDRPSLRYENGRHGKGGKRRRHTLGIGLFGEAFIIGTRETSHFYHDDIDDDVDEVKRLDS